MASERPMEIAPDAAGPIRFRRVDGAYLVSNDWGRWALLEPEEFRALIEGTLEQGSARRTELESKGFIKTAVDVDEAARTLAKRRSSVVWGPYSHLLCLRREGTADRMSEETAERCLEVVFRSTSPRLEIGFCSLDLAEDGELLDSIVESAERRNEGAGKELAFHLWSDLSGLDEGRRRWLVEHGFFVHALLDAEALKDGEAPVREHLRQLVEAGGSQQGSGPTVEVVVPHHRGVLGQAEQIVAWCTGLGCDRLRLAVPRPQPPGSRAAEAPELDEWLAFREELLSAVLAANARGIRVAEHETAILAKRIFDDEDPYDPALRSPATDGTGQLCYAWDGIVCTSDEGRRLYEQGDGAFVVGKVSEHGYRDVMQHPNVRAIVISSLLEGQPGCADCAYLPFCGQSPAHNYVEQGSIQGRMADSSWCRRLLAASDALFTRLHRGEAETRATLQRWADSRDS